MLTRPKLLMLVLAGLLLGSLPVRADDEKPEKRSGTITGVVTAKGKAFLEVKAIGEEKARRYVPHWVGGMPQAGGGPDKKIVAEIEKVKVGSRVKIDWEFEERPRVLKIEVLKTPEK